MTWLPRQSAPRRAALLRGRSAVEQRSSAWRRKLSAPSGAEAAQKRGPPGDCAHSRFRHLARAVLQARHNGGDASLMTHRILRTRHTPVHEVRAYGCHPTIVFVTVCTTQRRPILADSVAADTIVSTWRAADAWRVGRYVIMSDHVHIFCSPIDQ